MKKFYLLFILFFAFFVGVVNAEEVETFDRTSENRYGIPERFQMGKKQITHAEMTPYINASEKVYDFADLFTEEQLDSLKRNAQKIANSKNYEAIIVTIPDLDSRSARDYADDFYDYNDFNVDGILFLISLQSRDVYISTSGQGQLLFDSDRVDSMLHKVTPYLSGGNYSEGAEVFLEQVEDYIETGLSKSMDQCEIINTNGDYICKQKVPIVWILPICFLVSLLVTWLIVRNYKKISLASDADLYLKNSDLKLNVKTDQFLHTSTARIKIPSSSSSGGGGGSHHSSSGSSHGGGGGKF